MKKILAVIAACVLMMNSFLLTVPANMPDIPVSVNPSEITEENRNAKEEIPEEGAEQKTDGQAVSGPQVAAPSVLLMEASTGTVIFEKNADEPRNPASVTKIMTLILIFDSLKEGKIKLTDEVVTSAHAKSMGGSQVFLEEGELQTVETLIKCIVIASGNDASVAYRNEKKRGM